LKGHPVDTPDLFNRLSSGKQADSFADVVKHDVISLLNCSIRGMNLNMNKSDPAFLSVYNLGRPPLAGLIVGRVDPFKLMVQVRGVIVDFEPRVIADSVKVRHLQETDHAAKRFLYIDFSANLVGSRDALRFRFCLDYMSSMFALSESAL
jgi:type VI secretion system protein ImpF